MPTRDDIGPWLASLPVEVVELRARAGESRTSMEAVGIVPRDADAIIDAVDGAGYGRHFRVYCYDSKGKQITSRYFGAGAATKTGASNVPTTAAGALYMMSTSYAAALDGALRSNERLVTACASPMEALAALFTHERQAREDAETAVADARQYLSELETMADRAADMLAARQVPEDDPLRDEVARAVRGLAARFNIGAEDVDSDNLSDHVDSEASDG